MKTRFGYKKIWGPRAAVGIALAMLMWGASAPAAAIYDSGDNGTPEGGLLYGVAPSAIQALGSTITLEMDYQVTSIGVYVASITTNGGLDLVILPTTTYDGFEGNPALPDPLDLLSSEFSAHLGSLAPGLNSVSVDWELPAGSWFVAAIPVIDTLVASLSGADTPAGLSAHYGNNPYWLPMSDSTPSFRLEGVAVPEPTAGLLLTLGAGALLLRRRRKANPHRHRQCF